MGCPRPREKADGFTVWSMDFKGGTVEKGSEIYEALRTEVRGVQRHMAGLESTVSIRQ